MRMKATGTRRARRLRIMVLGLRGIIDVQGGIETHARRLYPLLARLGCDVEIRVRPPPHYLHKGPRTGRLTPHRGTIRVFDDTDGRAAGLFR